MAFPSDIKVPKQPVADATGPHGRPEWTYRFKGGEHMPKAWSARNIPQVSQASERLPFALAGDDPAEFVPPKALNGVASQRA